ncbi:MAG: hypothetical protein JOY90_35920 [Bradyrhizobium sp.]|nr:hypothetical protein [Bradyrhizobium sp.]
MPREEQTLEVLAALQRAEIEKWWPIIRRPVSASIKRARCNERSALALSRRTASGVMPVAATEKAATKRLGVRVFDASEAGWGIINQDLLLSNAKHWVVRRSIDALELDDCARRSACGP